MKKKYIFVIMIIILCLISFLSGILISQISSRPSKPSVLIMEETAPSIGHSTFINCMEGTTESMLYPDYWINPDNNILLYTNEEINDFNQNNPAFVQYKNKDGIERRLRQNELSEELNGQIIYSLLEPEKIQKIICETDSIYVNHQIAEVTYWEEIDENRNLQAINQEDNILLRYAVCIDRTVSMSIPSDDFVSDNPEEYYCNDMVSAEVMPGTGVIILHESKDQEWYYILNGSYCGWVHKNTLAICQNREEWEKICNPESFLIVTGSQIILDETVIPSSSSRKILPMGTKLALADSNDISVNGREAFGCYIVDFPSRDENGYLFFEKVTIPISLDVHIGYLTMTSNSVIEQSFKFLGQIYGWGGSFSSNDCSGIIRQVYACYGFQLPRNARAIAGMADLGAFDCEKMSDSKKYSVFAAMPAGLLLFMDGHLMIYLGMDHEIPYVISSCSSYIPPSSITTTSADIHYANCIFVSNLELQRKNGNTWFEEIKFFDWKEY